MNRIQAAIAVYLLVIAASVFYFEVLQGFGHRGLVFDIGGTNGAIDPLDALIIFNTALALMLLAISIVAIRRTNDRRIYIVSFAFFFFAVKEIIQFVENFFPREGIYTENAEIILDMFVILSFLLLGYMTYRKSQDSRVRKANRK